MKVSIQVQKYIENNYTQNNCCVFHITALPGIINLLDESQMSADDFVTLYQAYVSEQMERKSKNNLRQGYGQEPLPAFNFTEWAETIK